MSQQQDMLSNEYFEPLHHDNIAESVVMGPKGMVLEGEMANRFRSIDARAMNI